MPLILENIENRSGEIAQAITKALNSGDVYDSLAIGLTPAKLTQKTKKALKRAIKEQQVIQFDLFESIDKIKNKQYRVVIDFFTRKIEVCKISQQPSLYFDTIEVIDEPRKRANQSTTAAPTGESASDNGQITGAES